jgi:hypothetical protein
MKTFKEFLAEATKVYAARIKVAGELPEGFEAKLKDLMGKYETLSVKKVGATPIQEHPHEFPRLKNKEVTIYDVEAAYPMQFAVLEQVLQETFGIPQDHLKVKLPTDQTEDPVEMPEEARLNDLEFKDAGEPEVKFGDKYNMTMFKELMTDRKDSGRPVPEKATGKPYEMPVDEKNKIGIHSKGTGTETWSGSAGSQLAKN